MAYQQIFKNVLPRRVTLQYSDGTAQRTLLKIDCTSSEELSLEAQATLHDIEDGAQIADHVIKKGRALQIEGIISDAPINLTDTLIGNAAGYLGSRVGGAAGKLVTAGAVVMAGLALGDSPKPSKAALDIFEEIYANNTLLTIIAGLATYDNMIMEKFSAPRNASTAGALVFKASFLQVGRVSGRTVTVPRAAKSDDVKDLSSTEQQQGTKQGTALDSRRTEKAASWALQLGRKILGDD
jgi:hypothetical protein